MPPSENFEKVREAGERLQEFEWDFEVDLRDQTLRSSIDRAEGTPSAPVRVSDGRSSSRVIRAVREYYYDQFSPLVPLAHAFFESLTEAGVQEWLATRAGLEILEPPCFPSARVRYGPVPLPRVGTRNYDAFAEDQGGTHIAGARLIWWCAASHFPWKFGYTLDLSWHVWIRIPWIQVSGGVISLADGPLEAISDCVDYLCHLPEVGGSSSPSNDHSPIDSKSILADQPNPATRTRDHGPSAPLPPPRERWAIGQFTRNRWYVFRRFGKDWKYIRAIRFHRPQSRDLLAAFLEGKGRLTFLRGFETVTKNKIDLSDVESISVLDGNTVRRRVKSAVSYLRKSLYATIDDSDFDPIVYDGTTKEYRLVIPVGFAAEGLSDANESTGQLSFEAVT